MLPCFLILCLYEVMLVVNQKQRYGVRRIKTKVKSSKSFVEQNSRARGAGASAVTFVYTLWCLF